MKNIAPTRFELVSRDPESLMLTTTPRGHDTVKTVCLNFLWWHELSVLFSAWCVNASYQWKNNGEKQGTCSSFSSCVWVIRKASIWWGIGKMMIPPFTLHGMASSILHGRARLSRNNRCACFHWMFSPCSLTKWFECAFFFPFILPPHIAGKSSGNKIFVSFPFHMYACPKGQNRWCGKNCEE